MYIRTAYKIEKAALSSKNPHASKHPHLTAVYVGEFRGRTVAMAADGFSLAVVPVTLQDGDVLGYVQPESFIHARKAPLSQRNTRGAFIALGESVLTFTDGSTLPRRVCATEWPDLERVVPDLTEEPSCLPGPLCLDTKQIARLTEAIGAGDCFTVRRTSVSGPLLITAGFPAPSGFTPHPLPLACQMPRTR